LGIKEDPEEEGVAELLAKVRLRDDREEPGHIGLARYGAPALTIRKDSHVGFLKEVSCFQPRLIKGGAELLGR